MPVPLFYGIFSVPQRRNGGFGIRNRHGLLRGGICLTGVKHGGGRVQDGHLYRLAVPVPVRAPSHVKYHVLCWWFS
jgi:hypothetical protein